MPEVRISIGGRPYDVACQEGEEAFLHSAAALLEAEASVLAGQAGRIPEARMLLMAGLMLADKTAGLEDQLHAAEDRIAQREAELADLRARPMPAAERVEVPVIPMAVTDTLAELAARAEALAAEAEERAGAA
jgi:cell division protein ZapA